MPSFDIVSEIDQQTLDNAINNAKKEILNRYDFNGSKTTIELEKKNLTLEIVTEDDMKLKAIRDILISRCMKQGIDPESLDFSKEHYASGPLIKKDIKVKKGVDKETAKKIVKIIKDSGMKVQASIMDEQVRVTGKKLDDLQAVIGMMKGKVADIGLPLQYINFRN